VSLSQYEKSAWASCLHF